MTDYKHAARAISASPYPSEALQSFVNREIADVSEAKLFAVGQALVNEQLAVIKERERADQAEAQVEQLRKIAEHWRTYAEAAERVALQEAEVASGQSDKADHWCSQYLDLREGVEALVRNHSYPLVGSGDEGIPIDELRKLLGDPS